MARREIFSFHTTNPSEMLGTNMVLASKWWPKLFKIHQLLPTTPDVQTCPKSSSEMAKNPDKSYGWYKAQDFSDYIEEVVGEINFNSIQIILTTILR